MPALYKTAHKGMRYLKKVWHFKTIGKKLRRRAQRQPRRGIGKRKSKTYLISAQLHSIQECGDRPYKKMG